MSDDKPKVEVEESASYDNCLDENLETMPEGEEEPLQNNLADLMGIDPQPYSTEKWREHWDDPDLALELGWMRTCAPQFHCNNSYTVISSL